jgi:molybdenum cofactor biosynthesis enzyme
MSMIYQYYTLVPGSTDDVENMWDMVKSIEEMVMKTGVSLTRASGRSEGRHIISCPQR